MDYHKKPERTVVWNIENWFIIQMKSVVSLLFYSGIGSITIFWITYRIIWLDKFKLEFELKLKLELENAFTLSEFAILN